MNLDYSDYKDVITFYRVRKNGYGGDILGDPVEVAALIFETTSFSRGSHADIIGGSAGTQAKGTGAYLPADNSFIVERGQRLEGLVAQVNIYGGDANQQFYRVSGVTPVRDILLDNQLQHVECELTKIEGFSYVS